MLIGVIAACLPTLKSTFQRGLTWLGVKFQSRANNGQSIYQSPPFVARVRGEDFQLETIKASPNASKGPSSHISEETGPRVPDGSQAEVAEGSTASLAASASDFHVGSISSESQMNLVKEKDMESV